MFHGVFMEMNWLNIMLVIKPVIKRVVVLVYLLMLMVNLSIMIGNIVVGLTMRIIVFSIMI